MRILARSTAALSVLIWLILPAAADLRPPGDWDVPPGTVLNADPEPPWPMALHDGGSGLFVAFEDPDCVLPLPEPKARVSAAPVTRPPFPAAFLRAARAADLLTLHRRRNE